MKRLILSLFLLYFSINAFAQTGHWQGMITQQGKEYTISIYLEKDGHQLTGTSTILIEDVIYEIDLFGSMYQDRSMNLWDTALDTTIIANKDLAFLRRYQLIYRRGIAGDELDGYWQEVHKQPTDPYRRGFIKLKRFKPKA